MGIGFGFKQEPAASGTKIKDFENGNEDDAEGGRAVSGHDAALHDLERHENQRDDGAGETQIKAGIEKMLFVFEQAKFHARADLLTADFGQLHEASDVKQPRSEEQ